MSTTDSSSPYSSYAAVLAAVEASVRSEVARYDGSHDFSHIDRVRRLALSLAADEGVDDASALEVIELAALLHDIRDHKYATAGTESASDVARDWLTAHNYPADRTKRVCAVLDHIGFKAELQRREKNNNSTVTAGGGEAGEADMAELPLECRLVSDADRLDAMGAIGIARCFSFGGARGRAIYSASELTRPLSDTKTLTADQYANQQRHTQPHSEEVPSSLEHFWSKLLLLRSTLSTAAGRRRAQSRHDFMANFVATLQTECRGEK